MIEVSERKADNMKKNHIEIQRNNVTVSEFLAYIKMRVSKKGMERSFSPEDFTNPATEYMTSYTVVGDKKHCHFADYRTTTKHRRKHASYTTSEGFTRYYYTDEFEEYEVTELHRYDPIYPIDETDMPPCKAEIVRQFPYNLQTYINNWDGTCYNEICVFTFDDDMRGHGYYYQVNVWNEE